MAVRLEKGGAVSLDKEEAGLRHVIVGLGWDAKKGGDDFDLDASCFMLNGDGRCPNDGNFVYYRNLTSEDGSVAHTGDNLTGDGEGDDETIKIDLTSVPGHIQKLVFPVTIHKAEERKQSFGQVDNAVIRVANADNNKELTRYELGSMKDEDSMLFGELHRTPTGWDFRAIGEGHSGGLRKFCQDYGIATG